MAVRLRVCVQGIDESGDFLGWDQLCLQISPALKAVFETAQFSSVLRPESPGVAQVSEIPGALQAGRRGQTFQNPTDCEC